MFPKSLDLLFRCLTNFLIRIELKMLATDEISEYEDDDTESLDSFGMFL